MERSIRLATGAGTGSALAVLASYCAFRLHANLSTAGFIDLLIVLLVALRFGFWQATASSVVAVACLDYFFAPPILSLRVADPQNWAALAAFEATALIVSRLSNRAHKQTQQAVLERTNTARLYELSRSILVLNRQEPPGLQIASLIHKNIGAAAVAIFDSASAGLYTAGSCTQKDEELSRHAYLSDGIGDQRGGYTCQRVLRSGSRPIGGLVLRGSDLTPLMVDAIASLAAAAFERVQSLEKESRAEAARQSEQLRTTVLDGLAHAFKTPLTVILTSTSGLLEMKHLSSSQADLVQLIDQHASRLKALTTHLLRMAKLESEEIRLQLEEFAIAPLVNEIINECFDQLNGRSVRVRMADKNLSVCADRQLLKITITEFILNAAKYSTAESAIAIACQEQSGRLVVSVHNEGSMVNSEERERIFERFYRSPATKDQAPGSGIGLSVARKTAQAHQGSVWVNSDRTTGTTFFLSIPTLTGRYCEPAAG